MRNARLARHYDALALRHGAAPAASQHGTPESARRRYAMALRTLPLERWEGASVLDVGCGVGGFYGYASYVGAASYLGVDVSPEAVAAARRAHGPDVDGPWYPEPRFEVADVMDLDDKFDVVVGVVFFTDVGMWGSEMADLVRKMASLAREAVYFGAKVGAGLGWAEEAEHAWGLFCEVDVVKVADLDEVHVYGYHHAHP